MTKILVDNIPIKAEECPFAEYVQMTSKHRCMLKSDMYSRCDLECNRTCNKLKEMDDPDVGNRTVQLFWDSESVEVKEMDDPDVGNRTVQLFWDSESVEVKGEKE